jgi:hypothetical protein
MSLPPPSSRTRHLARSPCTTTPVGGSLVGVLGQCWRVSFPWFCPRRLAGCARCRRSRVMAFADFLLTREGGGCWTASWSRPQMVPRGHPVRSRVGRQGPPALGLPPVGEEDAYSSAWS